jgi:hypothetical protein
VRGINEMKKKLFHILNERKRQEEFQREQRERQIYDSVYNDNRRDPLGADYSRAYPLIDDDQSY